MHDIYIQSFIDKSFEPEGLPNGYPVPCKDGLLFYIQRNANFNTVVYEVNKNAHGQLIVDEPMKVYWIKYNEYQEESELNYIQNKLAYGYTSSVINNELIEFNMVCYPKLFFIQKNSEGDYNVITKINGIYACLTNVYVYAEEFGVFPDVQFIEIFGTNVDDFSPCYERIII